MAGLSTLFAVAFSGFSEFVGGESFINHVVSRGDSP